MPVLILDRLLALSATVALYHVATNPTARDVWYTIIPVACMFLGPSMVFSIGGVMVHRSRRHLGAGQLTETRGEDSKDPDALPYVLVVIPCHLESKPVLVATLDSVLNSPYSSERLHIFLSMDGEQNLQLSEEIARDFGIVKTEKCYTPYADFVLERARLTICVFEHGGKPNCLARTVEYIHRNHGEYFRSLVQTHVMMLDSDTTVPEGAIASSSAYLVR